MRNPLTVVHRQIVTPRAGYAAADYNRIAPDWYPSLLSADWEMRGELRTIRGRSRQLERDTEIWAGFWAALKNEVVGSEPDGIGMDARNVGPDGKPMQALNTQLEDAFEEWGEPETCTADGHNSWGDTQRLIIGNIGRDGEILVRRLRGFPNKFGYAVQPLDPDLLDEKFNRPPSPTANEIRMGVEIDTWGRPQYYHLWTRHPNDPGFTRERVRVPARDLLHLFVQLRPGQSRAVPWGTPAMLNMRLLDKYTEAEVTQAVRAARSGGYFVTLGQDNIEASPVAGADMAGGKQAPDTFTIDQEPLVTRALPPGMGYQPDTPNHPNANYPAFKKAMLQVIGRGALVFGPLSYPSASGDMESVNFSSGRIGLQSDRDCYRAIARWLTMRLHRIIYRDWLESAMLTGAIRLPTFDARAWAACEWEYRGWSNIQPLEEVQAAEARIRLGVDSRRRVAAETGRDFEDLVEENAEDQATADEAGVDVSGALAARANGAKDNASNQGPPAGMPDRRAPVEGTHNGKNRLNGGLVWAPVKGNGNG